MTITLRHPQTFASALKAAATLSSAASRGRVILAASPGQLAVHGWCDFDTVTTTMDIDGERTFTVSLHMKDICDMAVDDLPAQMVMASIFNEANQFGSLRTNDQGVVMSLPDLDTGMIDYVVAARTVDRPAEIDRVIEEGSRIEIGSLALARAVALIDAGTTGADLLFDTRGHAVVTQDLRSNGCDIDARRVISLKPRFV